MKRELKYYRWQSAGNNAILYDKVKKESFTIGGKVYAMSLARFLLSHLDKFRMDNNKRLQRKIKKLRLDFKKKEEKMKSQLATQKEQIKVLKEKGGELNGF